MNRIIHTDMTQQRKSKSWVEINIFAGILSFETQFMISGACYLYI